MCSADYITGDAGVLLSVDMKALILLATLKKDGLSNTLTLSEFLAEKMRKKKIAVDIVRLAELNIPPGTYSDMGDGDDWPSVLEQILAADIIIFATPIWWNNLSSLMQRVIERLDELQDQVMEGKPSGLEGKSAGIVVTGDSDGAQSLIGGIANFFNAVGLILPPYSTLTVLWAGQAKGKTPTRKQLMAKYEKDYADTADTMVKQLIAARKGK